MIRIGTRGSLLATTQAGVIKDALAANGHPAELVIISTEGDRSSEPIANIGVGVFTAALREAIADRSVDMAVHSYKDLPTAPDPRSTSPRYPARSAATPWWPVTAGARRVAGRLGDRHVKPAAGGTARALGLGLEIRPLRGNLDTRLNRVRTVISTASWSPGRDWPASDGSRMSPRLSSRCRCCQRRLKVRSRSSAAQTTPSSPLLAELDDADTRAAVTAERVLLAELEAGCSAPVGAIAEVVESIDEDGREELSLRGCVATWTDPT